MRSRFSISNYSNLGQRIITAIIGAVIIIAGSVYSEWAYFLIFGTILGFSQMEFYKLCGLDGMLPLRNEDFVPPILLSGISTGIDDFLH